MFTAGDALKTNITTLGPPVLAWTEQFQYSVTLVRRKIFKANVKPCMPDFKLAFKHFCFHPGGRAVMDEIQKNLQLDDWHMEPSRMTLHRFGNTSRSSIWYEQAKVESREEIKFGWEQPARVTSVLVQFGELSWILIRLTTGEVTLGLTPLTSIQSNLLEI